MDYRIIIKTEASGKKWYYVKKRFAIFFWRYLTEVRDMSMCTYKIKCNTLEEAEKHIQIEINYEYDQSQKKIVKREILER